jgi:uncharacterized protein with PIN domain
MSVPCPRCGREYDVTLFEFGRTIWCSCGSRVGAELRVRRSQCAGETRFIADAMLGRLAHWLRLLGFDCAYERHVSDEDLVRRGVEQDRVILTRDRALPEEWRVSDICVVRAEETFDQLGEVLRRFDLSGSVRLFTRCSECNRGLVAAQGSAVTGRVPAGILASHREFLECPGCGRVYWQGSHTDRMKRVVERLLMDA